MTNIAIPPRSATWKWSVCLILLLATMINYMDRLTVSQLSGPIMEEFHLNEQGYGNLDVAFSLAFAFGALVMGWMADRWNVWWIYPTAVALWSLAGALTGFVPDQAYFLLVTCRFFLGFTEAGHWPCALRTTQRILPPEERTLGNGILQSGAAVGSVIAPLVILALYRYTGSWRPPFIVIGAMGAGWVLLWLLLVRPSDLAHPKVPAGAATGPSEPFLRPILTDRRFWVLIIVVVCINSTWHFFRVWLPRFLDKTHHFSLDEVNYFTSAYYLATDAGSLAAGFGTLWLVKRGMSVHGSRLLVFGINAALTTLCFVIVFLPWSPLLAVLLMIIGFGALGLFPPFYSFSQELTVKHQGKLTGLIGFCAWMAMVPVRLLDGFLADLLGNFNVSIILAGTTPMLGLLALLFLWPKKQPEPAFGSLDSSAYHPRGDERQKQGAQDEAITHEDPKGITPQKRHEPGDGPVTDQEGRYRPDQ